MTNIPKLIKRFLFTLAIPLSLLALTFSPLPALALGGAGTAEDPYVISSEADLKEFRAIVNGESETAQNASAHAALAADVTLTEEWTPAGTEAAPYTGTFDGAGHEISGLSINRPDEANGEYIGLFGYIDGGVVKNLTVRTVDANTAGGEYAVTGYQCVGIIAGYINDGATMENCVAYGSVNATCTLSGLKGDEACYVGGIVGGSSTIDGSGQVNRIIGCTNNAVVHGAGARVGGIAGYSGGVLSNCINKGNVSGDANVGGIAGMYSSRKGNGISNCTNNATVSGDSRVGGIAGEIATIDETTGKGLYSYIKNCTNNGDVTGNDATGGIAGFPSANAAITNCTNTGGVSGGTGRAGGIAGFCNADGVNGVNLTNSVNTGSVTGSGKVGGLVGDGWGYKDNCGWLSTATVNSGIESDGSGRDVGTIQSGIAITDEAQLNSIVTMLSATIDNSTIATNGTATITLETSIKKDSFDGNGAVQNVAVSSSAEGVATAKDNGDGTITVSGAGKGTAVITVTAELYATDLNNIGSYVADKQECEFTFNVTVTDEVMLESISIPKEKEVKIGRTETLDVAYTPSGATNKEIEWKSDAPNIATVDENGTVTGVAEGTATITATPADTSKGASPVECTVTVSPVLVEEIAIAASGETKPEQLETETEYTFNATVSPSDATDKTVEWSVTGAKIVEGSETDSSVTILTGSEAGQVSITATANDKSGKTSKADYSVIIPNVESVTVKTDKETMTGGVGDTANVTADVKPINAQYGAIEWTSGDETTATVTPDAEDETRAVVTAKGAGEVTITATAGGVSGSCTITIDEVPATGVTIGGGTELTLEPGGTKKLTAELTPTNSTDKITWTSSDTKVATVSEDGTITAVGAGASTITAATASGQTASITVTVTAAETPAPDTDDKPAQPSGGGSGGGCSAGFGALALLAAVPLLLRRKK